MAARGAGDPVGGARGQPAARRLGAARRRHRDGGRGARRAVRAGGGGRGRPGVVAARALGGPAAHRPGGRRRARGARRSPDGPDADRARQGRLPAVHDLARGPGRGGGGPRPAGLAAHGRLGAGGGGRDAGRLPVAVPGAHARRCRRDPGPRGAQRDARRAAGADRSRRRDGRWSVTRGRSPGRRGAGRHLRRRCTARGRSAARRPGPGRGVGRPRGRRSSRRAR